MTQTVQFNIEVTGEAALNKIVKQLEQVGSAGKKADGSLRLLNDVTGQVTEKMNGLEVKTLIATKALALQQAGLSKTAARIIATAGAYEELSGKSIRALADVTKAQERYDAAVKKSESLSRTHTQAIIEDYNRQKQAVESLAQKQTQAIIEDRQRANAREESLTRKHLQAILEDRRRTAAAEESLSRKQTQAIIENKQREINAVNSLNRQRQAARQAVAGANVAVAGDTAILRQQIALMQQGRSAQEALTVAKLRAKGVEESLIQGYLAEVAALNRLTAAQNQASNSTDTLSNKSKTLADRLKPILNFTIGLTIFSALTGAVAGFDDILIKAERVQIALQTVTGSAGAAAATFKELRAVAEGLALPSLQLAEGFTNFAISAKGSALSANEIKTSFLQVTKAAAGAGLQTEQFDGVMRALTQIMSKGKLQAEELRGQLGDRLPGAFVIAARAMGVTTAELDKMLKNGEVISDEFIPKFAKELENIFGPAAEKRINTFGGSIENLKNQFRSFALDSASTLTGPLTASLNALASAIGLLSKAFVPFITVLASLLAGLTAFKIAAAAVALTTSAMLPGLGALSVMALRASVAFGALGVAMTAVSTHPIVAALGVAATALTFFWIQSKKAQQEQDQLNQTLRDGAISLGLLKEQVQGFDFDLLVKQGNVEALKEYRTSLEQITATRKADIAAQSSQIEAQREEATSIFKNAQARVSEFKALDASIAQRDKAVAVLEAEEKAMRLADFAVKALSGAYKQSAGETQTLSFLTAGLGDNLFRVLDIGDKIARQKIIEAGGDKIENDLKERIRLAGLSADALEVEARRKEASALAQQQINLRQANGAKLSANEIRLINENILGLVNQAAARKDLTKTEEDAAKRAKSAAEQSAKQSREETKKALEKLQALRDVNELLRAGIPLEQAQQQVQKEAIALTGELKDEYISLSKENRNLEDIRKSTIASAEKELQIKERLLKSESDMRAAIQQRIAVQGGAKLEDLQPKEQNSITDQIQKMEATVGPLTQEMSADLIVLKNKLVELNETDLSKALDALNKLYKDSLSLSALDISGVFGKIGNPFEEAFAGLQNLMDAQETYDKMRKEKGADLAKINFLQSQNEIKQVGNILGASKKLFKEKSAGYKAITIAEKTFRAVELALAIKNTLQKIALEKGTIAAKLAGDALALASSLAVGAKEIVISAAVATGKAIAAIAGASIGVGPAGFIGGAAMAAAMAGLGIAVGGFGGGSGSKGQSAAERQAVQGTGSVLGDVKGQSESLVNALTQIRELESADLQISKGMLTSLRNIESSIGGFVNVLFRANSATGTASPFAIKPSTSNDKLGNVAQGAYKLSPVGLVGSILEQVGIPDIAGGLIKGINGGIFGSTKIKQIDSGINIAAQDLGDILAGNFAGTYYATIEKTKKKLFGLSKTTSTQEITQGLDSGVSQQLVLIFQSITDAVVQSVAAFGIGSEAALKQLQDIEIEFQKISLEGLSTEDAQKAVESVFGKFADNIVSEILPSVEQFQNAGEGLFETLSRVASETFAIQAALKNLGLAAQENSLATVEAYQNLVVLSGGIDQLGSNLAGFYENFLSADDKFANVTRQVQELFAGLNRPIPATREEFKKLVQSLNLTTASGQEAFAALISAQSVANEYYSEIEKLTPSTEDATNALQDFLDKLGEVRSSLQRTLVGLSGGSQAGFDVGTLQSAILAAKSASEVLALINPLADALEAVYNGQLQGIEKTKNAQIEAIRSSISLEKTALETQQEALKKQIDSSEKLRDLAVSIRDYTTGLRINANTSTGNPFTRLAAAQAEFTRLAQAAKTGDVDAAGKVTGAASDVLETAKEVFASSTGYASIFNATENTLNDLTGILSSSQSDSTLLASIDAQILALTSKQDMQIAAVEAAAAAQQALAKLQFQQQIGILLQAVNLLEILGDSASDADLTALKDAIISGTAPLAGVIAELTRTANETVTRNIRIIVESSIPDEVKRLALLTNESVTKTINAAAGAMEQEALVVASLQTDTVTRTVNAVQGGTLTAETAAIVFARTDTLTRTIAASAGAFPQVAKDILYATSASVTRTINAALGTGNAQALQIALLQSDTITRTVNAVQGGTLSPAVAAIVFAQTDSLTRTVNAVTGNLDQSARDLIYAASSSITRYVNAAMGNSDTDALRVALATSDTVTRTINAALQGGALTPDQRAVLEAINGSTTASLNANIALNADGSLTDPLKAIKDNTSADEKGITSWLKSMNINLNAIRLNTGAGSGEPGGQSNVSGAPAQGAVFWLELIYNRQARIGENIYRAVENLDGVSKGYGTRAPAFPAYALGGVFTNSIVSQPTLFNPSLMGEAGPEAIMPLSRTSDGSLGVKAVSAANDSGETVNELKEINRQQSALIRLQQEANKQMIAKLTQIEDRLAGVESKARLQAAA